MVSVMQVMGMFGVVQVVFLFDMGGGFGVGKLVVVFGVGIFGLVVVYEFE